MEDTSKTDFSDNDRLYYYLVPRFGEEITVYAPVNSDRVKMREVMARRQAECSVAAWPPVQCKKYTSDRERPRAYKGVLQPGDCLEPASMVKEIANTEQSHRGNGKMLSVRKRDGAKCARKPLSGELVAVLDIHSGEVPDYIQDQTGCSTGTV